LNPSLRASAKATVGSFNAGGKSTVARGTSEEVGAVVRTLNYTPKMKIGEKLIEGREILFDMLMILKDRMSDKSVPERYEMR
jgi:hypothetical protein